jgi:ABC-type lipoprotein release transport system permease subunit
VNDGGSVLAVQRPAEILNYRTLGTTPTLLGVALATGAVVALGLTLVTSVRRRRRDLALLKTLGFTRRQLAATLAWQASVAVAIGCAVGIPLGIALGRFLWDLFAREISAIPDPTVPAVSIVLIALGAIILANLVAAVPGRIAAQTRTAQLLRSE